MIYIVTLIVILFCVLYFDFGQPRVVHQKKVFYYLLLTWLILISGLGYNVGADTPGYMRQYADICSHHFKSWGDLSYLENRQPGWMLLNISFSYLSHRFVYMKLFIAIFSNCVILSFIKKHTKYLFLGIILYYVFFYLNWNFNSIRQTMAISFFLIGYDYLVEKRWIKYFICCVCAFMFHSSAIICFLFPLLYFIKVNSKWLIAFSLFLLAFSIFAVTSGGAELLSGALLQNAELMTMFVDNSEDLAVRYFGDNAREYGALNIMGLISIAFNFTPIFLVYIGVSKRIVVLPHIGVILYFLFVLLFLLDYIVPVIFMRFLMYLDIIFICALTDFVVQCPKRIVAKNSLSLRNIVTVFLIAFAMYRPVATFFRVNILRDELPFYRQFYPYYSVFDPQIDPERAAYYDFYKD